MNTGYNSKDTQQLIHVELEQIDGIDEVAAALDKLISELSADSKETILIEEAPNEKALIVKRKNATTYYAIDIESDNSEEEVEDTWAPDSSYYNDTEEEIIETTISNNDDDEAITVEILESPKAAIREKETDKTLEMINQRLEKNEKTAQEEAKKLLSVEQDLSKYIEAEIKRKNEDTMRHPHYRIYNRKPSPTNSKVSTVFCDSPTDSNSTSPTLSPKK